MAKVSFPTATGDNVSASSVPSLSPYVAPAGGITRVDSLLSRLLEPCFVAISSRQPGNTSAQIAHPPDRQPGAASRESKPRRVLRAGTARPPTPGPGCGGCRGRGGGQSPCAHACRECCLAGHAACRASGNLRAQGALGGSPGNSNSPLAALLRGRLRPAPALSLSVSPLPAAACRS